MITLKDAIHGNIYFSGAEAELLDTFPMQRLRNIKQLGFSYLVYPSATHTRFEHSIGVFYLAGRLGEKLGFKKNDLQKLKIAALLHDIGHGPFSHSTEDAIKRRLGAHFSHEENTYSLIKENEISNILEKFGHSPYDIVKILSGKKQPLSEIVSGEIDVDRMDYLIRDSYSTGALYGVIDLDRTLDTLKIYKNNIVFTEDGLSSAESFVRARYLMYPTVYSHHATRTVNSMFSFAVAKCIRDKIFSVKELGQMDDIAIISVLRSLKDKSGELMRGILQRDLYKRALILEKKDLKGNLSKFLKLNASGLKKLEKEIIESCNLDEGEVLIDIPEPLYSKEAEAKILSKGKIKKISEVSPLAKSLADAQWSYWNVAVYCKKENLKKVQKAAKRLLRNA